MDERKLASMLVVFEYQVEDRSISCCGSQLLAPQQTDKCMAQRLILLQMRYGCAFDLQ